MFCPGTAGVSAERKPSSGTQTFYLGTYDIIEDAVKARKCGEEMHEDILEWYYYSFSPSRNCERSQENYEKAGGHLPMIEIPIWEKSNLTLEEAAAYSGIGINKLRKLSDSESCPFVLWIGSKRLIKRRKLDEYTDRMYSL